MTSNLQLSSQLLTFLTILGMGFLYVVATALLGALGGDHDAGDHSVDGHDSDHGHGTISVFSPKVIAIFMVGFGGGGAIASHYGFDAIVSTLIGLASGGSLGGLAFVALRALYSQQASSDIYLTDTVGLHATVTSDIPSVGRGEVGLTVKGQYLVYSAASRGTAIPRNTNVKVLAAEGSYLIVQ